MELHEEAVEHLDHHTRALEEGRACSLAAAADTPGHATWEAREVDHVRRRSGVHLAAGIEVGPLHREVPFRPHASADRPCARARRLVPERRLV